MTFAERLSDWNRWYDGLPQEWRFQLILWPLIALGVVNMLLSLSSVGFPFGLLVLLGVLFVAAVRVPFILGWITPGHALPSGEAGAPRMAIGGAGADWIAGLNERYEAVPESRRFWIFPAILLISGAINMQLTISYGWSFGLLFLLVLLAIIVVRAPYVHGLLRPASADSAPAPALQHDARIADQRSTTLEPAGSGGPAPLTVPAQHDMPAGDAEAATNTAATTAPPRSEPGEKDAAPAPAPDTGLASGTGPRGASAISSPFAAPPHPEPDAAHAPAAPKPLHGSQTT